MVNASFLTYSYYCFNGGVQTKQAKKHCKYSNHRYYSNDGTYILFYIVTIIAYGYSNQRTLIPVYFSKGKVPQLSRGEVEFPVRSGRRSRCQHGAGS